MKNSTLAAIAALLTAAAIVVGAALTPLAHAHPPDADEAPPFSEDNKKAVKKAADKKEDKKADKKTEALADLEEEEDRSPNTLYAEFCSNCHDPGIAGAPKTADPEAWSILMKSRGFDALVLNTIKGAGLMPSKGACVACTDKEIEDVVKFMLDKAKVKYP